MERQPSTLYRANSRAAPPQISATLRQVYRDLPPSARGRLSPFAELRNRPAAGHFGRTAARYRPFAITSSSQSALRQRQPSLTSGASRSLLADCSVTPRG